MSNDSRKAIPIREAFELLDVSPPTGYGLIHSGKLRSFKIGRRRYATPQAVDDCIATLERESAEVAA